MTRAFWFVAAIYGAEAASQRYFQVPAAELSERQAILLAAVIVNPRRYSPLTPSRRIEKRAHMIASRLRRAGLPESGTVPGGNRECACRAREAFARRLVLWHQARVGGGGARFRHRGPTAAAVIPVSSARRIQFRRVARATAVTRPFRGSLNSSLRALSVMAMTA